MRFSSFIALSTFVLFSQATLASMEPFPRDAEQSSYRQAIKYGYEEGFVSGYPDRSFRPDAKINRAEFVRILTGVNRRFIEERRSSMPDGPYWEDSYCIAVFGDREITLPFSDVREDVWYARDVCHGLSQDLLDGYSDGTFRPAKLVNFAEAAKILVNVFDVATNATDAQFLDQTVWYRPYTEALRREKAIAPSIPSYDHEITRGEMMEMIYRLRTDRSSLPSQGTFRISAHPEEGYSLVYNAYFFVEAKDKIWWPFDQSGTRIPATEFVHAANREYCGESGLPEHCKPLTRDISVAFAVIPQALPDIGRFSSNIYDQQPFTLKGRTGKQFVLGVEGDNTYFYFLPTGSTKTLMIVRHSIDENNMTAYKDEPTFIPLIQQQRLFDELMSSLEIVSENSTPISLYFYSADDLQNATFDHPVHVVRMIERTPRIADATLKLLMEGPNAQERTAGAFHSSDLASLRPHYLGVTVKDGLATVNFKRAALSILNAEAARQYMVKMPIQMTLKQFPTVREARYAIDGELFDEWDA